MEKQKFIIPVIRSGFACRNIEVEATSQEKAERLALEDAGNHEFTEHTSEYDIDSGFKPLKEIDLIKIYQRIDTECISETENVSMTTIRKVFSEFGVNPAFLD